MTVEATTRAPLPAEVRAARSLRASEARRGRRARRRRATRRRRAAVAVLLGALVAAPAASDASSSGARTAVRSRPCPVPAALRPAFAAAAHATSLPVGLLAGMADVESHFSTGAESPAGAVGVMQLMPSTAASLHYDARHPATNVMAGAAYLRQLLSRYDGDLALALAAYNAGPTAVDEAGAVPYDETRAYVTSVERTWRAYARCA